MALSTPKQNAQTRFQPPANQPPLQPCQPLVTQPPLQPYQTLADDTRYGFSPLTPTTQEATIPQLGTHYLSLPSSNRSPPRPSSQTPPQSLLQSIPEPSDLEDEEDASGLEIDEQSDDEDDRQAHALLSASPNQVTVSQSPIPQRPVTMLPAGDHHGFAVCVTTFV